MNQTELELEREKDTNYSMSLDGNYPHGIIYTQL